MRRGLLMLVAALSLPSIAAAQLTDTPGSLNTFGITVSPQYPAPGGTATLTLISDSINLANSAVSVSANGKKIHQGTARQIPIALGKAGSVTSVTITVISEGREYTQNISIQPQDVALVAEPVASTPPLYPGKPFVPLEGDTRVVAVANLRDSAGKPINPSSISYAWTVEGAYLANLSGIGRSSLVVASPLQYRARDVSVAVTNTSGTLVGGAALTLSAEEPAIRLYENDPLLGIMFDRTLPSALEIDSEFNIYAAVFSLPVSSAQPILSWSLDGTPVQTGNFITLRPSGSGRGSSNLMLSATGGKYTTIDSEIRLTFGSRRSTNIFGL